MLINVTQDHIDRGRRCSAGHCPVALAIKGIIGQPVCVTFRGIKIGKHRYTLPWLVMQWIVEYDSNLKSKPFKFTMENIHVDRGN